jgi:hypothetical protein
MREMREVKTMSEAILVREWNTDKFHQLVLDLEARGYVARRETYRITPEMHPETGEVIHLHTIEMSLLKPEGQSPDGEDAAAIDVK